MSFWRIIGLGVLGLVVGCRPSPEGTGQPARRSNGKPVVYVVNYPLKYFADRIGGDAVEVVFPAPGDVDPAHWMPDRATIKAYQGADLILLNGASYAKWLDKVSLPESRMVDTSAAYASQLLKVKEVVTHSHGKGGEHSHVGTASHTWLNPRLAALQAEAVREALTKLLPDKAAELASNYGGLAKDLAAIDADWEAAVNLQRDRPVVFSHPVYQYFQQRFAVNSRSLQWDAADYPSEEEWEKLETLRKEHAFAAILWESEPLERTRAELERRGVKSLVVSPCANQPAEGDFLSVMRGNVIALQRAYE